jgi:hypothetical protein
LSKLNSIHACTLVNAPQANKALPTHDLKSWQKMNAKHFDLQLLKIESARPSDAHITPEMAWVGLTRTEAKA